MTAEEEVTATIRRFFSAMDSQNLEMMQALIPNKKATVHVGTDKGEIWKGQKEMADATEEQFKELEYYKTNIRDLRVNISDCGKVAWYFHKLDAEIKSGNDITRWRGARFTGVLQKNGDRWKMEQSHVSLPKTA